MSARPLPTMPTLAAASDLLEHLSLDSGLAPGALTHADADEYLAFVRTRPDVPHPEQGSMQHYRSFRRQFPDLGAWMQAPLSTRVGTRRGVCWPANCSAYARPYLYYLVYRGTLRLDWPWILAIRQHILPSALLPPTVVAFLRDLGSSAERLGFASRTGESKIAAVLKRLYLHLGPVRLVTVGEADFAACERALADFGARDDLATYYGDEDTYRQSLREHRSGLFTVRTVLYHQGLLPIAPARRMPARQPRPISNPAMGALLERYLNARQALHTRPETIAKIRCNVRCFIAWLAQERPENGSFAQLAREDVLAYAASLEHSISHQTGKPLLLESRISRLSDLAVFFQDTTSWGWEEAPSRPLLGARDLPKRVRRIPRFIPADQRARLMEAVRMLPCPYQRTALLVARWSGARRGEIRALDLECLDAYPDGTPRLRIPVGKGQAERLVPLHPEAATAIRALAACVPAMRGFRHDQTGVESRRLFVRQGRLLSVHYLFEASLAQACRAAGLTTPAGAPLITAHQFRHTVATELAEGGARLHTIMKMLGHTSTEMTLVYAHISDRAMAEDYAKVLGPGMAVAGPIAEQLRSGTLPEASVEWLKANFLKTELELGHCLRLPEEGPCECDLYLSCAKFVTTREYAPRLRARHAREQELMADAQAQGWPREVERHACVAQRIEQLLAELGEPLSELPALREG
jgi:integrase